MKGALPQCWHVLSRMSRRKVSEKHKTDTNTHGNGNEDGVGQSGRIGRGGQDTRVALHSRGMSPSMGDGIGNGMGGIT